MTQVEIVREIAEAAVGSAVQRYVTRYGVKVIRPNQIQCDDGSTITVGKRSSQDEFEIYTSRRTSGSISLDREEGPTIAVPGVKGAPTSQAWIGQNSQLFNQFIDQVYNHLDKVLENRMLHALAR